MDILQFIVERYNYWIFIILMMTGLYTVIARDNLIKKIIGLNIFQTSVFIFYISIGKVAGGTAPIYVAGDMERRTDHGGGHDGGHGGGHNTELSGAHDGAAAHAGEQLHSAPHGDSANTLSTSASTTTQAAPDAAPIHAPIHVPGDGEGHHDGANETFKQSSAEPYALSSGETSDPSPDLDHIVDQAGDHGIGHATEGAVHLSDIVYSNPLPHVLILTAIVVGVATTAVGLALIVRIREAYGVIEEADLEAADNIAEFGHADPRPTRGGDRLTAGGAA